MTERRITSSQQPKEALHPDVVAFCDLLARIMNRCLREQDPQIMATINTPSVITVQEGEVSHAA